MSVGIFALFKINFDILLLNNTFLTIVLCNVEIPTKRLCILVPAPLEFLIFPNFLQWCKKRIFLVVVPTNLHHIW